MQIKGAYYLQKGLFTPGATVKVVKLNPKMFFIQRKEMKIATEFTYIEGKLKHIRTAIFNIFHVRADWQDTKILKT